ncbi:MAG: class I SAM-dependent methyltransferase [Tetragenococcus sp.]|nr:class I SAM-dependent methyltransferase [Tetragenococcus sp.]
MSKEIDEVRQFWDDFAEEYTTIQTESQLPIQKDVVEFLQAQSLLPQASFLDLAGGSGKYVPYIISHVQNYVLLDISSEMLRIAANNHHYPNLSFLESSQEAFLTQTKDNAFDMIFTAMNPALTSANQLTNMRRIAKKYVCILRLVEEKDPLFSPVEEKLYGKPCEFEWMNTYKRWLDPSFHTKSFDYTISETISREFFRLYFTDELPTDQLEEIMQQFFQGKKKIKNTTHYTFELVYC